MSAFGGRADIFQQQIALGSMSGASLTRKEVLKNIGSRQDDTLQKQAYIAVLAFEYRVPTTSAEPNSAECFRGTMNVLGEWK
jgi:hypothetical protein